MSAKNNNNNNKKAVRGMNPGDKLFIVRKYIVAKSALDAIKKDKVSPVADVWVDESFKESQQGAAAIGFVDYRIDNE